MIDRQLHDKRRRSPRMMVYLSIRPVSTAITIPAYTARRPPAHRSARRKQPQNCEDSQTRAAGHKRCHHDGHRRSRGASSVRAPITDGTLQPNQRSAVQRISPASPAPASDVHHKRRTRHISGVLKEGEEQYIMPICGTSGSTVLIPPPRPGRGR